MKRLLSVSLFVALLALPMQAKLKFGVRGGYNITQMTFSEEIIEPSNKEGFFVGPVFHLSFPTGLGFELAGLYDQRDTELEGKKITQKFINVPLNLRLNIGLGGYAGIYLAAGPQVAFNIGDKDYSLENFENGYVLDDVKTYRLRDSNFSVNIGGGIYLSKRLEVGCTYNTGIGKTGELRDLRLKEELDKSHTHTWQISATFFF